MLKRLINLLDSQKQCTKDPKCHRVDGHADRCKSFGVVLVEKAEQWIKEKLR